MSYQWDVSASRYRDAQSGRFVSETQIRSAVDQVVQASTDQMVTLTKALQEGRTTLAVWQADMMRAVKDVNLATAVAAHGGRQAMAPADWLYVARDVKAQYQYLRGWAQDIASGAAPLDGRLIARAELYGIRATAAYEGMKLRDVKNSGATVLVRNVLAGGADHCHQCPDLSARGWVPADEMVPVGSRQCMARDRCHLEFRAARAEAA